MKYFASRQLILCTFVTVLMLTSYMKMPAYGQQESAQTDPVGLFNQGQEAHEKGDFEKALKFYSEAIEIFPEFAEAEYQRGMVLLSLQREEDAEKALRRALELRPDWSLPMTSLGVLLVGERRFAEAEPLLTRAIDSGGDNFVAYSAMTDLRIKSNAGAEKLRELLSKLEYLTTKPNPPAVLWASRAALERALGDKKSARNSLNRAIEIDPLDKSALSERAEMALADGDSEFALGIAQKLKQMSPGSSYANFLFARILAFKGDFGKALEILDSIPGPTPEMIGLREKIEVYRSEDPAELERQIGSGVIDPAVFGRLCGLYRTSSPLKALDNCRRASELEPGNLSHAVGYGAALVQAKQYTEAIGLLRRIIAIAPDNFTARANFATALFQAKNYNEAISEYAWIANTKPDLPITYYFLAISHDSLGEYIDAMANYEHFLKIADPRQNELEMDKAKLRIEGLKSLIKQGKGKKND